MHGIAEGACGEAAFRAGEGGTACARDQLALGVVILGHPGDRVALDGAGGGCGGGGGEGEAGKGCGRGDEPGGLEGGEVGLGGRPGGGEKAAGSGFEFSFAVLLEGGEEVELLAGAGAGDVEEALAFGGFAGGLDGAHPVVEPCGGAALGADRSYDAVGDVVRRRVRACVGFEPVEQAAVVVEADALEGGDEDEVPLQAFGAVDGHEVDGAGVDGGCGIESGEALVETVQGEDAGGLFKLVEQGEEALGAEEGFFVGDEVCAEGSPGAVDPWSERGAAAFGEGDGEDGPEGGDAGDAVFGKKVAALVDEVEDGSFGEGGIVLPGEQVEVDEGEAAPGRAQEGQPGGAVGGVEEGAGEGDEVEDLLALGEGFDLDGAVGDGGSLEGGDDLGEVDAVANEDGDGWGFGVGGTPRVSPGADGGGDLGGVDAALGAAHGGALVGDAGPGEDGGVPEDAGAG